MQDAILVEVCCGSIDDAIQAQAHGADRIELNSAFFLGGLTPSYGTFQECKQRLSIPIMVMVRPRSGGMHYSEAEFATMLRDAEHFAQAGADGIVFGCLNANGSIDVARTQQMMAAIGDKQAVFHRAFDVTPDPFAALDTLIELGVKRVLTSGQQSNVFDGYRLIQRLLCHAAGRIEILPGAGLNEHNLAQFVSLTGVDQVHIAPMGWNNDLSTSGNPAINYGGALYPSEIRFEAVDGDIMRRMKEQLLSKKEI